MRTPAEVQVWTKDAQGVYQKTNVIDTHYMSGISIEGERISFYVATNKDTQTLFNKVHPSPYIRVTKATPGAVWPDIASYTDTRHVGGFRFPSDTAIIAPGEPAPGVTCALYCPSTSDASDGDDTPSPSKSHAPPARYNGPTDVTGDYLHVPAMLTLAQQDEILGVCPSDDSDDGGGDGPDDNGNSNDGDGDDENGDGSEKRDTDGSGDDDDESGDSSDEDDNGNDDDDDSDGSDHETHDFEYQLAVLLETDGAPRCIQRNWENDCEDDEEEPEQLIHPPACELNLPQGMERRLVEHEALDQVYALEAELLSYQKSLADAQVLLAHVVAMLFSMAADVTQEGGVSWDQFVEWSGLADYAASTAERAAQVVSEIKAQLISARQAYCTARSNTAWANQNGAHMPGLKVESCDGVVIRHQLYPHEPEYEEVEPRPPHEGDEEEEEDEDQPWRGLEDKDPDHDSGIDE